MVACPGCQRRIYLSLTTDETTDPKNILARPARELIHTGRSWKAFARLHVQTIGDLVQHTADDFRELRNCGEKTIAEIQESLVMLGLSLRD